jgi:hypothetical protein
VAFDANEICFPTDAIVKAVSLQVDLFRPDIRAESAEALADDRNKVLAIANGLHSPHALGKRAPMFANEVR